MKSRVLGIKKSIILSATAVIMFFSFTTLCILSFTLFKRPDLWFYSFMLCLGIYEFVKGILFDIDSSFYFGLLLIGFGSTGFLALFLSIQTYFPLLFGVSGAISSIVTFLRYKQDFHLVLAFSIIFVCLYGYIFIKKLISLDIFIAFTMSFLLLLFMSILANINGEGKNVSTRRKRI